MTDVQLYLAIGIPSGLFLLNFIAIVWQSRGLERSLGARLDTVSVRIDSLEKVMESRFDAHRQMLLRVEGVIDARLKHLEER